MEKQRFILMPGLPNADGWARPQVHMNAIHALKDLAVEEPIEVIIRPHKKSKSDAQLGYLWGVVLPAIRSHLVETGDRYTTDDIYGWMVEEYASSKLVTIPAGATYRPTKVVKTSASRMKVGEMSDFIDCIIQHAAEHLHLPIPPADPYHGDEGREEAYERGG